jgi:hypothetical protein
VRRNFSPWRAGSNKLHPGKLIVAGGHYASCAAQPLLEHHSELDIIVIHEGEQTLGEIVAAAANLKEDLAEDYWDRVPGRWPGSIHAETPNAGRLGYFAVPRARRAAATMAGVPTSLLMGSRGCYENCAYCCVTTLHNLAPGKKFRQRFGRNGPYARSTIENGLLGSQSSSVWATGQPPRVKLVGTSNRPECMRGSEMRGAYLAVSHTARVDGETDSAMRTYVPQPSVIVVPIHG